MAVKKVGTLIKEARTKAGLTQAQLAAKVKGLTAADISKAERGEKDLTQEQLKTIASVLGVTQKSLLDAAKGVSSSGKTGSTSGKTGSTSASVKLTAAEKELLTLYRKADADTKNAAVELLKKGAEETGNLLTSLLGGGNSSGNSGAGNLIGSLLGGNNNNNNAGGNIGAALLGSLLGGGNNNNNNSGNAGASLLTGLLGGVLGGREMPDGGEQN